jgi:hypothetical protein
MPIPLAIVVPSSNRESIKIPPPQRHHSVINGEPNLALGHVLMTVHLLRPPE